MLLRSFLGLLALVAATYAADSEGTSFYWTFVRNYDPDPALKNQQLSVTVMNGNNLTSCDFSMMYKDSLDRNAPFKWKTVTVATQSTMDVSVPSYYGFAYDTKETPQSDSVPKVTLFANASCPVTLIANNYDNRTQQGDSFIVLPVQWASTAFTFTLPAATPDPKQYQQISFIPTTKDAVVTLTVLEHGIANTFPVKFGDESTAYFATTTEDKQARTYHIESNQPIQVVAGVTCLGVAGSTCDHAAFMPQPLPANDCRVSVWMDDDHPSDTLSTGSFYVDTPPSCVKPQTVAASSTTKDQSVITRDLQLNSGMTSSLQTFSSTTFGNGVTFHADTAPVHVTRVYDQSTTRGNGAFLTSVPSISQFLDKPSYFYTRSGNDTVEVLCQVLRCSLMYIDGSLMMTMTPSYSLINVDAITYYTFSINIDTQGFHTVTFSVDIPGQNYLFYVLGKHTPNYGYVAGVNLPKLVLVNPTTTSMALPTSGSATTTMPSTAAKTTMTVPSTAGPTGTMPSAAPSTTMKVPSTSAATTTVPTTAGPTTTVPTTAAKTTVPAATGTTTMPSTAASTAAPPASTAAPPASTAGPASTAAPPASTAGPASTAAPPASTAGPASTAAPPASTAAPPASTAGPASTAAPPASTAAPPASTAAPPASTAAPPASTAAPPASTAAPPASTAAPPASTAAPSASTAAPPVTTAAPPVTTAAGTTTAAPTTGPTTTMPSTPTSTVTTTVPSTAMKSTTTVPPATSTVPAVQTSTANMPQTTMGSMTTTSAAGPGTTMVPKVTTPPVVTTTTVPNGGLTTTVPTTPAVTTKIVPPVTKPGVATMRSTRLTTTIPTTTQAGGHLTVTTVIMVALLSLIV